MIRRSRGASESFRERGFTLVEMLVVVVIIGILAAILVPAVYRAILAAQEGAYKAELGQLANAIEIYRSKYGDYPPDFSNAQVTRRHFIKLFPRMTQAEVNYVTGLTLTRAQALVFCLRGYKSDIMQPFNGAGDRIPLFDFDRGRLSPTTVDQSVIQTYLPRNLQAPYVYFDARTYAAANHGYDSPNSGTRTLYPYRRSTGGTPEFVNPQSFQLICAGMDNEYCAQGESAGMLWPEGIVLGGPHADNLANFSTRRTLGEDVE